MTDFLTIAREIVADRQPRGTSLFGWATEAPETAEDIASRMEQSAERTAAYLATPRGKFHRAAFGIFEAGLGSELLSIATRGGFGEADRAAAARIIADLGPMAADAAAALAQIEVA